MHAKGACELRGRVWDSKEAPCGSEVRCSQARDCHAGVRATVHVTVRATVRHPPQPDVFLSTAQQPRAQRLNLGLGFLTGTAEG